MSDPTIVRFDSMIPAEPAPEQTNGSPPPQPEPTVRGRVLVVEDGPLLRKRMVGLLSEAGYEVLTATDEPSGRAVIESRPLDLVFLDLGLAGDPDDLALESRGGVRLFRLLREVAAGVPVVIVTADATAASAVELLQAGAFHYLNKPVDPQLVLQLAAVGVELGRSRRSQEARELVSGRERTGWLVGPTARMKEAARLVALFAPTSDSLLIQGETGTGKDVVAREIHRRSKRADGPFIAVNCAALAKDLLESELFGHEKGAFTGAVARKRGRLELADGGTLFLDELTSMDAGLQAKLLRALQDMTFMRVGGEREIRVDVRVIAASNRDVQEAIDAGDFRSDLYYRICVVNIDLAPLRHRVEDVATLAGIFITERRVNSGLDVSGLTERAALALGGYAWPGNIRELKNVIERATVMAVASGSTYIDIEHLPSDIGAVYAAPLAPASGGTNEQDGEGALSRDLPPEGIDLLSVRDAWEARMMRQALARPGATQASAARLLQLSRDMFRSRMAKFGIDGDGRGGHDEPA